ncbi:hypothetical protein LCGC14_1748720 [marine sediment metagenome]|uniref:PD-(D/E)XK endonuclease-like domain-containing protein n=1 Tax=marine sediment metagenome TaxID=412755 RepID=A0A0F9K3Z2_9ZZZZ
MNWSISKAQIFSQCQRKWFYYEIMAKKNSRDKDRFEAYVLKQVGSIHSWRGKIVDYIIENLLIPEFNEGNVPSLTEIEIFTSKLMLNQLKFAQQKKYRDPKITKKEAGENFCALREIEHSIGLNDEAVEKIKEQVMISLKNLLQSNLMKILLDKNTVLVAQKILNYRFNLVNVIGRPDLIIYFKHDPPMIIDWKVYLHRNNDARLQLGTYAIALSECVSHDPFQKPIEDPTKIKLIEYQLLKNFQRYYQLTYSEIRDIESFIKKSSKDMVKLKKKNKYHGTVINQFKTINKPELCNYCSFKTLCSNKRVKYQVSLMKFGKN